MTQLNAPQNPHKNCTNNGINQVSHRLIPSAFPNIFFIPRFSRAPPTQSGALQMIHSRWPPINKSLLIWKAKTTQSLECPLPRPSHPAFGWLANCLVKITFLAKINSNQSAILEKQKCIKIILGISHTFALPPSPRPPLIPVPGKAPAKGELICLWLFKQIKRHIKNDIVDNWRKQGNIAGLSVLPICRSVYVSAYLRICICVCAASAEYLRSWAMAALRNGASENEREKLVKVAVWAASSSSHSPSSSASSC